MLVLVHVLIEIVTVVAVLAVNRVRAVDEFALFFFFNGRVVAGVAFVVAAVVVADRVPADIV